MRSANDKESLRRALAEMRGGLAATDRATQTNKGAGAGGFVSGVAALDRLAPRGAFARGAVHELLWPSLTRRLEAAPLSLAMLLAGASVKEGGGGEKSGGAIAWSDPHRELYLPALAAGGIDLRRLILVRCQDRGDRLWALAECLRCRGVSATVAIVDSLSRLEARRMQLAAERGGGVGIFLRPHAPLAAGHYAAATRWLVGPAPGSQQLQRWSVQLLHGHGGQIGTVLLLEVDRETRAMRAVAPLADRSAAAAPARASA